MRITLRNSGVRLLSGAAWTLAFSFAAAADPATQPTLPEVVVTTSPIIEGVNVDPYSGSSARVGADQISDQNSVDLPSALRDTPGVEISKFNPVGSYAGDQGGRVFIHGLGSGAPGAEIQTYIDDVPVYSPVWGHPLLDALSVNGMSAIDVYKGPRPWINGDNWGSINLVTARPTQDGVHGDAQISGGMLGTVIEKGSLFGKFGATDFSVSEGFARSDGARPNAEGQIGNFLGRIGYQFTPNWRADLNVMYVNSIAYDPQPNLYPPVPLAPHYDTQLGMIAGTLSHDYSNIKGDLKLYFTDADSKWLDTTYALTPVLANVYNAEYAFQTGGLRWRKSVTPWAGGTVDFGLDQDRISGHNTTEAPFPTPVNVSSPLFVMTSPYVGIHQDFHVFDGWTLTPSVGVRMYFDNIFATEAAPHAGVQLSSNKFTIYTSYSRGIHYPGLEVFEFSQLYPFFGNSWRGLTAERDEHVEAGIKTKPFSGTEVDVNLFTDWVSNRYDFDFATGTDINFGAYRSQGFELAVKQSITPQWQAFAGWTFLTSTNNLLPFMPHDTLALGLNGTYGKFKVVLDGQYRSSIWGLTAFRGFGIPVTEEQVNPFFVANMRLSYAVPELGKKGEVFVVVENLFNAQYSYTPGYPQPGAWAQVGVTTSF